MHAPFFDASFPKIGYFRCSRDKRENYFKETCRSEWSLWPGERKIGANEKAFFYQRNWYKFEKKERKVHGVFVETRNSPCTRSRRGLEFGREGGRAIFGSALEQGKRLSRVSRTPPLLATEKPSRYRPELFDIWDEADRLLPNFFLPLPPVRKFPPERRQTRSLSLSSLHFFQKIASSTLRYIDGDVVSNALLLRYSFCSRLTYDLPYFLNTRMLRKRYIPISFAFFLSYDSRTLDFYGLNFDAYDTYPLFLTNK